MNAHTASLINSLILIAMGLWGYFGSESPSFTALIPVVFGVALLLMNNGIKKENKIIAHIAVVLTLLVAIALFMPLKGAFERSDNAAIVRVALMEASSIYALIFFIKSFIDARKNKA